MNLDDWILEHKTPREPPTFIRLANALELGIPGLPGKPEPRAARRNIQSIENWIMQLDNAIAVTNGRFGDYSANRATELLRQAKGLAQKQKEEIKNHCFKWLIGEATGSPDRAFGFELEIKIIDFRREIALLLQGN